MRPCRILSLWFPRLAAERALRTEPGLAGAARRRGRRARGPGAGEPDGAAEAAGCGAACRSATRGRSARARHPSGRPWRDAAFLGALRRWAGNFSPWVAEEEREALALDVTGCAHLFGGEAGLAARIGAEAAGLGLSLGLGLADTLGAAWAVARYAGAGSWPAHAGDAIDQEARATRSRAGSGVGAGGHRRPKQQGGPGAAAGRGARRDRAAAGGGAQAGAGRGRDAAGARPRRIAALAALPRAAVARRFGPGVLTRLDQALGRLAEPVSPAPAAAGPRAAHDGFPEPIGTSRGRARRPRPAAAAALRPARRRRLRGAAGAADPRPDRRHRAASARSDSPGPPTGPRRSGRCWRCGSTRSTPASASSGMRLEATAVEPLARASTGVNSGQLAVAAAGGRG